MEAFEVRIEGLDRAASVMAGLNNPSLMRGIKFFIKKRLDEGVAVIQREAPEGNTKQLRDLIEKEDTGDAESMTASYTSGAPHTRFVVDGTGIYGPHKKMIVPSEKPFMVFFKENKWVRVKSTKGSPPNDFMARASVLIGNRVRSTLPFVVRQSISVIVKGTA